ncbi:MAG: hypothetical protein V4548_13535 [Bacteroidota bacterium]
MKKTQQTITILVLMILVFSCGNKKSDLELEKNVMLEIYPSLIDSLWVHNNSTFTAPTVELDSVGNSTGFEKPDGNKLREKYIEQLDEIRNNKSKIVVTLVDTIHFEQDQKMELKKYFKDAMVSEGEEHDTIKYAINTKKFNKIKSTKINFISNKKLDKTLDIVGGFCINGILSFSRIQFDDEKKYGILTSDIICGETCGHGYRIFIKKVDKKWVIDKVEEAWSS